MQVGLCGWFAGGSVDEGTVRQRLHGRKAAGEGRSCTYLTDLEAGLSDAGGCVFVGPAS